MSLGTRWNGVFCFLYCFSGLDSLGDAERLRLAVGTVAESEEEVDDDERLVFAVEGFCVDVACSVSLESLGVCADLRSSSEEDLDLVSVGLGG